MQEKQHLPCSELATLLLVISRPLLRSFIQQREEAKQTLSLILVSYRDQYGQWIIREVLAEHEGKYSDDLKCSKFRWPETVRVKKEILQRDWTPADIFLLSSTFLGRSRDHPHSHHPCQVPILPLSQGQTSQGPQSCCMGSVGFKESTHPQCHLGFSSWTEQQLLSYLSQRQNNLNLHYNVNFTRQSVRAVSKI